MSVTQSRPYQENAVNNVFSEWENVRSVCLVAPTGAGKTVMAEMTVRRILAMGKRIVFFAHRTELIDQTFERFERAFPGLVGKVQASSELEPGKPIQVASIQTCLKRSFWPEADFVILDECHHYESEQWQAVDAHYSEEKSLQVVGSGIAEKG